MEMRFLAHAAALADHETYARAAKAVGISQSALSRSIQALEAQLGVRLFDRSRSGCAPTAAGQELLREARPLLSQVQALTRNMALLAKGEAGALAMGCGPLPARIVLEGMLTHLARHCPEVRVEAQVGSAAQLLSALLEDRLEFIILAAQRIDLFAHHLTIKPIGRVRLAALVRSDHPLLGKPVDLADLRRYPVAIGTLLSDERTSLARFSPTIQCDDYDALRRVTLASDTIWFASDRLAGEGLVPLPLELEAEFIQLVAIAKAGRTLSPIARRMIALGPELVGSPT